MLLLSATNPFALANDCGPKFLSSPVNPTYGLITYVIQLLERRTITERDLVRFSVDLRSLSDAHIFRKQKTAVDHAALIHYQEIRKYIQNPNFDRPGVIKWIEQLLSERALVSTERDSTEFDTAIPMQIMEFHRVQNIEVMSTPVTQKMWTDIMASNPSYFKTGKDAVALKGNDRQIITLPNHPVENITWWAAIEFANRLSVLHGYKPAYVLEHLSFREGTSPENGDWASDTDEVIINAEKQDIYLTEGYRLPTDAEQDYLFRNAMKEDGNVLVIENEPECTDYAWFDENSYGLTHPVASRDPLYLEGHAFYDLYGNVKEWSHDAASIWQNVRIHRGGGFESDLHDLKSYIYGTRNTNHAGRDIGLRLVRNLPRKSP